MSMDVRKNSKNGYLECLEYAHENGCPWDRNTIDFAVEDGHLNYLKYAHENCCPVDEAIIYTVLKY